MCGDEMGDRNAFSISGLVWKHQEDTPPFFFSLKLTACKVLSYIISCDFIQLGPQNAFYSIA